MPIIRVARAQARVVAPWLPSAGDATDSSDFGLLGEQSFPKWEIPCPGRQRTTVQNLTPLALSSAEKYVTVQTQKTNKQTINSNRHIHTLPIGM